MSETTGLGFEAPDDDAEVLLRPAGGRLQVEWRSRRLRTVTENGSIHGCLLELSVANWRRLARRILALLDTQETEVI